MQILDMFSFRYEAQTHKLSLLLSLSLSIFKFVSFFYSIRFGFCLSERREPSTQQSERLNCLELKLWYILKIYNANFYFFISILSVPFDYFHCIFCFFLRFLSEVKLYVLKSEWHANGKKRVSIEETFGEQ